MVQELSVPLSLFSDCSSDWCATIFKFRRITAMIFVNTFLDRFVFRFFLDGKVIWKSFKIMAKLRAMTLKPG